MIRLKDRQRQIPNGIFFYLAQTKWRSSPGSFDSVTKQLLNHLRGNPAVAAKLKWPLDEESIANVVDSFNAKVCEHMGWKDYITGDIGNPKPMPPSSLAKGRAVVAGANALNDWFGAGGQPVSQDLAESRASTCVACPKNEQGDWTSYFTVPASNFIRKQLEKRTEMKLATSQDDKLNVCSACLCPLRLKVWCPAEHIIARITAAVMSDLDPGCWIIKERNAHVH